MSNRPFKKHQFLQSQALHNGLFQDLHSAYICMKKLQEKGSSAYLSFGHLIKKVIEIHFYHINEVAGEQLHFFFFCMWQMSDLRHGLNVKKDSPCFFQVHQGHDSLLLVHVGNTSHTAVALALFPLQSTPRGLFHFFQLSAQESGRTPARERAEIEGRLLCMIRRRYSRGSFISQGKSLP